MYGVFEKKKLNIYGFQLIKVYVNKNQYCYHLLNISRYKQTAINKYFSLITINTNYISLLNNYCSNKNKAMS